MPVLIRASRSSDFSTSASSVKIPEACHAAPMRIELAVVSPATSCWNGLYSRAPSQNRGNTWASNPMPNVTPLADPYSCADTRRKAALPPIKKRSPRRRPYNRRNCCSRYASTPECAMSRPMPSYLPNFTNP
ncbi:MAG: hypothetical protein DYG98_26860 [Haliscomenobacteraceae bacterium CHB4]|nr:hypothetical protein [Haliscomenobacteraceae bacterium CHB4]